MAQSQSKTVATMTTTFDVAGQDADMVIGFQNKEMYLALQKELPIGSPISVAYWLKEQYGAEGEGINLLCPDDYKTFSDFQSAYNDFKDKAKAEKNVDAIKRFDLYDKVSKHLIKKEIPNAALHIMISAILAEVVITDLIFQRKTVDGATEPTTKAKLGLAINFPAPLVLLPSLAVRKIALLIMYASNGDLKFPVVDTKPEQISIPAEGWIDFAKHSPEENDTITLGPEAPEDGGPPVVWTFVKKGEGNVEQKKTPLDGDTAVNLSRLVKDLNESQDKIISQCKYKLVEKTKLKITAQAGGAARNSFKLAASAAAIEKSGDALKGGVGELKEAVSLPAPTPPPT